MSEQHADYNVENATERITEAALLPFTDDRYEHPTAADVRALKALSRLTGRQLCLLAGVEDLRTWRRWSQEEGEKGARKIPYSAWRLLLIELNLVDNARGSLAAAETPRTK